LSGTLLNYAGVQLLPWLTLFWHDSSVVATAGVLGTAASFIRPVMQSMIHFLVPRFSETIKRQGLHAARSEAIFLTQAAIVVGIPLSAALYWAGDGLVELIYGKVYCGYAGTLTLFSVAAFIRAANAPMRSLITAAGQAQRLVSSGIGATLLCVLAAWLWIPRYGVTGYAIAYLIYNGTFFLTNSVQANDSESLLESRSAAVVR
jgi:O-antigen/teichoic acid export membrane protein